MLFAARQATLLGLFFDDYLGIPCFTVRLWGKEAVGVKEINGWRGFVWI
jgi:hypothetical protein